jgi:cysteine-rich repeat protein
MRAALLATVLAAAGALALVPSFASAGSVAVCGDGVTESPELCDDGNTAGGDGCSANCLPEVCGDGITEPVSEECDDANTVDDDDCTDTCQFDCGDGETDASTTPPEQCDDGNETNGDGCDDDPANATSAGNCTPTACGNGVIAGLENCDDGNTVDGDGCEADCTADCVPTDPDALKCIRKVNEGFATVVRAQGGDAVRCLREAAAGRSDFATCLPQDGKGKVQKAQAKTVSIVAEKCDDVGELPGFAFTDAATVNEAAEQHTIDALFVAFGDSPVIAGKASDQAGAACQRELLKRHRKLQETAVAELNRAKKGGIRGICSGPELAPILDSVLADPDPDSKLNRAKAALQAGVARKCTDPQIDALFDCGEATSVAALVACDQALAVQAACEAFEEADALDLDCD